MATWESLLTWKTFSKFSRNFSDQRWFNIKMNIYFAVFLIVFLLTGLVYSTYSFSQGRFMEGMAIFPWLIACYFFVQAWDRRNKDDD